MFAVLKTGGKQYKVTSGDVLRVEKLDAQAGDQVQFNEILMVGDTVGTPLVEGAGVQAEVIDQIKGAKTINFVKRRRKHGSQRKKGHRQQLTLVRIGDILESGADNSGWRAAVSGRGMAVAAGAVAAVAAAGAAAYAASSDEQKDSAKKTAKKATKAVGDAADDAGKTAKGAAKKAASTAKNVAATAGEAVSNAGSKPANLLAEARDGQPDDLKQISGVGPALEKKLHDNGVFHFDQIAAWKSDEIAYMDDQLSFKGRIERDEWIKQASEFAKG